MLIESEFKEEKLCHGNKMIFVGIKYTCLTEQTFQLLNDITTKYILCSCYILPVSTYSVIHISTV